jgi:WNK lysine deficient protein kinase
MDKHTCKDPSNRFICTSETLGSGACKTVYRAFDRAEGKEVAWSKVELQSLDMDGMNGAMREVEIMKEVDHPHIVKLSASWVDAKTSTLHLITDLYAGSLDAYVKLHGRQEPAVIRKWARQICNALVYLHDTGSEPIVHRDLKCANVFVNNYTGDVAVGDLGYATVLSRSRSASVIGTPEFMAPEVLDGNYSFKADIYAFGMVLIELATLRKPYSKWRTVTHIYMAVLGGSLPEELELVKNANMKALIKACLSAEENRPTASSILEMPYFTNTDTDHETMGDLIAAPLNFAFLKGPIERYCLSKDSVSA